MRRSSVAGVSPAALGSVAASETSSVAGARPTHPSGGCDGGGTVGWGSYGSTALPVCLRSA